METLKIFDSKFHEIIQDKIKSVLLENSEATEEEIETEAWKSPQEKQNSLTCSHCRAKFENITEQREHYKLDWHRYNLKQSLLAKQPISEEEFTEKNTKDDVSSISGSDSDKEDSLDTYATAQGKIFLQNGKGQVFSLYACLLCDKKEEFDDESLLKKLTFCCRDNQKWTLLMLGGGHFAGAVFKGSDAVLHKTFHCYTVRAGQGGGQSSRDNKSGGSQPKSAGASLRRYNEQALVQHVKNILDTWKSEIEESSLVIYRAAGPYNRSVLFGGAAPLLNRSDKRLRTVPFSTRRATFTEIKRVHAILTQAVVYNSMEVAIESFSRQKQPEVGNNKRNKIRNSCINRAKSREIVERALPVSLELEDSSESSDSGEEICDLSIDLRDSLQEFDDSLTPEQRRTYRRKKPKKKSKNKKLRELEEQRKRSLIDILVRGDLDNLEKNLIREAKVSDDFDPINEVLDDDGNSLLHVAAMNEHCEVLRFLLNKDANPCLKNKKQCTAYTCTQSKEIRETLKEFARENPDKYNYNKAQIPTNVLTPEELADKKKAQRKLKREKEKIKKKENDIKRQEDADKERFLRLSDREKRALAAERRILSQSGSVISRCFLCACDISGKVPFEYLGNRFCSVECLKAHRMQNPIVLS